MGWLDDKYGDVVKDNNGYWNPDNWGKPVEINSNQITMKGVNQPLIGVSDAGDVQYMEPNKDYKFKGKKVTEIPVAQDGAWLDKYEASNSANEKLKNGGKIPLQKINKLTTFTTSSKENWLDKYE